MNDGKRIVELENGARLSAANGEISSERNVIDRSRMYGGQENWSRFLCLLRDRGDARECMTPRAGVTVSEG